MKKIPLILGASRLDQQSVTLQNTLSGEDRRALYKKVFERDDHRCGCCDFRSEKYQEVLYLDRNLGNFDLKNLMTICTFCYQVFHLEKIEAMRSGVLIWLPEMSQVTLNHLMRAIYVARITQGPMAEAAKQGLDFLMNRRKEASKRIGSDDPALLARLFTEFLENEEYQQRAQKFDGIKLMPLDRRLVEESGLEFNQFPQMLAYWRAEKGPFGQTMPATWFDLLEEAKERLGIQSKESSPASSAEPSLPDDAADQQSA